MFTYDVNLQWKEGRRGLVQSPVLSEKIEVATPPEFPKGVEDVWSPEHFFVAAINSCLMTTFLAVAENSKLEFESFDCTATGTLDKVEGKYMMTTVELRPVLLISRTDQQEKAQRVLEMAEKACLISNSVKSVVTMKPTVLVAESALPL